MVRDSPDPNHPPPRTPNPKSRIPSLYAILDADVAAAAAWTLPDLAAAYLNGGARLLQIRAKRAPSGWLLDTSSVIGEPVVAIGGITLDTAPGVLDAGAAAVAVIGDLIGTGNPEARVRDYVRRLGSTPLYR